jgi:hypothetical protein
MRCSSPSAPASRSGVKAYANAHPKFPDESTVIQFFNEAEFENYRHLGSWEFGSIIDEFSPYPPASDNDIKTLFNFCEPMGHPRSLLRVIKL